MNRKDSHVNAQARRGYEAPCLRRVRLVPDEAVLASCKNNATAGPTGVTHKCSGVVDLCSKNAS